MLFPWIVYWYDGFHMIFHLGLSLLWKHLLNCCDWIIFIGMIDKTKTSNNHSLGLFYLQDYAVHQLGEFSAMVMNYFEREWRKLTLCWMEFAWFILFHHFLQIHKWGRKGYWYKRRYYQPQYPLQIAASIVCY